MCAALRPDLIARLFCLCLACRALPVAAAEPFVVSEIPPAEGRSVAAEVADLNGDGRDDLFRVVFAGIPPNETRQIRVHFQDSEGRIAHQPDFARDLPAGSAAFDLADVRGDAPGQELLLLRAESITVLSLAAADAPGWELEVPGGSTFAAAKDERGLDRYDLVSHAFGDEPWILVPLLRSAVALRADGSVLAHFDVGARANYYIPLGSGPLVAESDIQIFLDAPRLSVSDVDGDGRVDVVSSDRHDVRVFLRREDGSFPRTADRVVHLARVNEPDHIRGSGAVRARAQDMNGDGRADLLISHAGGGISDARNETRVHLNRGGTWNLDQPDQRYVSDAGWGTDWLIDLDGDSRPELVRMGVPISVFEIVELLVTRAVDVEVSVHDSSAEHGFGKEPTIQLKLDVPLSFETGRTKGFVPTVEFDLNGDGHRDLLTSGSGDEIGIWPGGADGYRRSVASQDLDTRGRLRAGDLNGDGLLDLLLYDPRDPQASIRIAHNRGVLPGTLPRVGAQSNSSQ